MKKTTTDKTTTKTAKAVIDVTQPKQLAEYIANTLSSKKAGNILIVDVASKTVIADYFVIASASNTTQCKALANILDETLVKNYKLEPLRREGISEGRWVALDYNSVIVHIFLGETRDYYQLERLWVDGANAVSVE